MNHRRKQRRQKTRSGYLGLCELDWFTVWRRRKANTPLLYPSCYFCFGQHLRSTFFLLLSPFSFLSLPHCPPSLPALSLSRNWCSTGSSAFHPRCFAPSFGCHMKGRLHKLTADPSCPQEVCPIPGFRVILSWWTKDAIKILFFPSFWPAFPLLEQSYGYKMGTCQPFQKAHACSAVSWIIRRESLQKVLRSPQPKLPQSPCS